MIAKLASELIDQPILNHRIRKAYSEILESIILRSSSYNSTLLRTRIEIDHRKTGSADLIHELHTAYIHLKLINGDGKYQIYYAVNEDSLKLLGLFNFLFIQHYIFEQFDDGCNPIWYCPKSFKFSYELFDDALSKVGVEGFDHYTKTTQELIQGA
jgi:hypothetical protein